MPTVQPGPDRNNVVAAVDWGGTWIRVGLATADGQLLRAVRRPRPDGIGEQCSLVQETLAELARDLGRPASALGVGIAGITRAGQVESASNLGIRQPFPLASHLRERSGLRTIVVNDTQAAAIAEAAALDPGTSVLLTVGTGIGGAIVHSGRLVVGSGAAGDFGHMIVLMDGPECSCGGRGCLEAVVSGRVLNRTATRLAETGASRWLARRAADHGRVHAGDLDLAAQAGDGEAVQALQRAAAALITGLRSVTAAADPRIIVLGGGLLSPRLLLTRLVHQRWQAERPRWSAAQLRPAALGADAGLRGAALLAAAELGSESTAW
jgi:glucokinase